MGKSEARVLVVVAHPDDEVLGAGGTASALTSAGIAVTSCILAGNVEVRHRRPADGELRGDIERAASILGMGAPIMGDFPNIRMNTVPHLDMVEFIERAIVDTGATELFTHHPADLNDDHRQVSLACQTAARLPQRRNGMGSITGLHLMEIASSTDWSYACAASSFTPTTFFEIGQDHLAKKLEALSAYREVMRPFPHPRSTEVITGMAATRGAQFGANYAEAFQSVHVDLGYLTQPR